MYLYLYHAYNQDWIQLIEIQLFASASFRSTNMSTFLNWIFNLLIKVYIP